MVVVVHQAKEKHAPLYRMPGAVRTSVIAPTAEETRTEWAYALEKPAAGWAKPGFDDSAWKRGAGGFGTKGTPGAEIGPEYFKRGGWHSERISKIYHMRVPGGGAEQAVEGDGVRGWWGEKGVSLQFL